MPLSYTDLPMDDGFLPAGKWLVQMRDPITDSFAGAAFKAGITVEPINGRLLKRLVTFMKVDGALRVEGEPCELGDCSTLKPAPAPVPEAVEQEPVKTQLADKPESADHKPKGKHK
jgi:hypothetical protein